MNTTKLVILFGKFHFLFIWLRFFYPFAKNVPIAYKLYCFIPQKIFRRNGPIPWPVHPSTQIVDWKNINVKEGWCAPGLSPNCYIHARNGILLGNNVRIGPGVGLISANHDLNNYDKHLTTEPIRIGNNVWIGMNSVVLPGVQIGDNVAIGAGSIVTKDLPPNSIAVGHPCRVIRAKDPYCGSNSS